jgi:3-hydroxyisobutyrate dehydrogenase-like beta-hydroxyacid dehydrogenase
MGDFLDIGIIGLGVMGQRMLARLAGHARLRTQGQAEQLRQWVALIEGRAHHLPGCAEALAVQQTTEQLLAGG